MSNKRQSRVFCENLWNKELLSVLSDIKNSTENCLRAVLTDFQVLDLEKDLWNRICYGYPQEHGWQGDKRVFQQRWSRLGRDAASGEARKAALCRCYMREICEMSTLEWVREDQAVPVVGAGRIMAGAVSACEAQAGRWTSVRCWRFFVPVCDY